MPKLVVLDEAYEDLVRQTLFIADASGSRAIAEAFATRIQERCRRLAGHAFRLGRARPEIRGDLRSVVQDGHIILFRYIADTLEIVAIVEGHRDLPAFAEELP